MNRVLCWIHLVLAVALLLPPAGAGIRAEDMPSECGGTSTCCCDHPEPVGVSLTAVEDVDPCPCSTPAPTPTRTHEGLERPDSGSKTDGARSTARLVLPAPTARPASVWLGAHGPSVTRCSRALICSWTL